MIASLPLLSIFWFAFKGIHPFTGRRLHPFQRRAIALNFLLAAAGCIKLLAQLCLSRDQQRFLGVILDTALAVAGLSLSAQVCKRLTLKLQRQERDRP